MLLELDIRNLAVIEELHLSLRDGLNVLTGETGAGKSILIDAIGLVLGNRASGDLIRTGAEEARVEALFQLPPGFCLQGESEDFDIEIGEGGQIVLSRELSATGKNTCRINGRLATVGMLRSLAGVLVDIHGQHQHQSLLRPERHVDFLDNYGGPEVVQLRRQLAEKYRCFRVLKKELANLEGEARERAQKLDLYSFQASEIAAAGLVPGEEEELKGQLAILENIEKLNQIALSVYQALYEEEDRFGSVVHRLGQVASWLGEGARFDSNLVSLQEAVQTAIYQLEDVAREVRAYRDNLDLTPGRLEEVQDRLFAISQLKRKYGDTVEEILEYHNWAQKEIDRLENSVVLRSEIEDKLKKKEEELVVLAQDLSGKRQALALDFALRIQEELAQLGMDKTEFAVLVSQQDDKQGISLQDGRRLALGPKGIDQVEFLLAPNPGENPKSLVRIASGGELSRVMLALKNILVQVDPVPTLIFDEIDAGVGGRAAQAVAERLTALGRSRQVLCVTHLPQIASMADAHWKIFKEVKGDRTFTRVVKLTGTERVDELARMLGGTEVTTTTKKHAQEMIKMGNNYKKSCRPGLN